MCIRDSYNTTGRRSIGQRCVLRSDGDCSSSGWYKRSYDFACSRWRVAKLGRIKKIGSCWPSLAYIDRWISGIFDTSCVWCIRTVATKTLQGVTNCSLMTAPGVHNTSPATCVHAYHIHVVYATIGKIAGTGFDTHPIFDQHVMPGWVVGQ